MLRLTLRSGRDGRFLARIIDRGGSPFLLDYGDPRIIQDAAQRVLKGFTMWRSGRLVVVTPQDSELLQHLAELYAHEGLLVFLEEPTWHGQREAAVAPADSSAAVLELADDFDEDASDKDAPTETVSPDAFRQMVAALQEPPGVPNELKVTPGFAMRASPTPAPAERMFVRRRLDALTGRPTYGGLQGLRGGGKGARKGRNDVAPLMLRKEGEGEAE